MKKSNKHAIGNPLLLRLIKAIYPTLEKVLPKVAHLMAYHIFFTPIKFKTPKRELDILLKANKSIHQISGRKIQFYQWGNESDPLVILVHGWMGRASQFYKLIEGLLKTNHYVLAFDGPAHGASTGKQTNMNEFAECIEYIDEQFGSINCAIGHSFGGITILNAIQRGLTIKKVALVATPSISDDIVKQFEARINASPATGVSFRNKIMKKYGIDFKSVSAGEMIKKISIDCLMLVHDEDDHDVPFNHAQLMKDLYPTAITIFTSELGHTRILRNEEVIEKMLLTINAETGVRL